MESNKETIRQETLEMEIIVQLDKDMVEQQINTNNTLHHITIEKGFEYRADTTFSISEKIKLYRQEYEKKFKDTGLMADIITRLIISIQKNTLRRSHQLTFARTH